MGKQLKYVPEEDLDEQPLQKVKPMSVAQDDDLDEQPLKKKGDTTAETKPSAGTTNPGSPVSKEPGKKEEQPLSKSTEEDNQYTRYFQAYQDKLGKQLEDKLTKELESYDRLLSVKPSTTDKKAVDDYNQKIIERNQFAERRAKELDDEFKTTVNTEFERVKNQAEGFDKALSEFQQRRQPKEEVSGLTKFVQGDAVLAPITSVLFDAIPSAVAASKVNTKSFVETLRDKPPMVGNFIKNPLFQDIERKYNAKFESTGLSDQDRINRAKEVEDAYRKHVGNEQFEKEKALYNVEQTNQTLEAFKEMSAQDRDRQLKLKGIPQEWADANGVKGVFLYGLSTVAEVAGQIPASIATLGTSTYFMERGDILKGGIDEAAKEKGVSAETFIKSYPEEVKRISELADQYGAANAALDLISLGTGIGLVAKKAIGNKLMKDIVTRPGMRALINVAQVPGKATGAGIMEGFTEGWQETNTIIAEKISKGEAKDYTDGFNKLNDKDKDRIEEAARKGGFAGAVLGGGGGYMAQQARADRYNTITQQRANRKIQAPPAIQPIQSTPEVIQQVRPTIQSTNDTAAIEQAAETIINSGGAAVPTTTEPVEQAAIEAQQGVTPAVQESPAPVGQGATEAAATVLDESTNQQQNEQGNEIDTKASGTQQESVGIQQEDAEGITRRVQEAGPATPGAQRTSGQLKKETDKQLEEAAREKGSFIENPKETFGEKIDGGTEQDVYLSKDGDKVIKVNGLSNHGSWAEFWDRLNLQKNLFPDVAYKLIGFTKSGGRLSAVVEQPYIKGTEVPRKELIQNLAEKGFYQIHPEGSLGQNQFYNPELGIRLTDVHGENVIKDADGNIRYIDPMLDRENPFVDEESKQYFNEQKSKYTTPAIEPDLTLGTNYQKIGNEWQVKQADGTWAPVINKNPTKQQKSAELKHLKEIQAQLEAQEPQNLKMSNTEKANIKQLEPTSPAGKVRKFFWGGGKVLWNSKGQGTNRIRGIKEHGGLSNNDRNIISEYVSDDRGMGVEAIAESLDIETSEVIDILAHTDPKNWYADHLEESDEYTEGAAARYEERNKLATAIAELEAQEQAAEETNKQLYENERRVDRGRPNDGQGASGQGDTRQQGQEGEGRETQEEPSALIRENGNENKSKQAVSDLGKLNLTHVSGLGMGQNQAKGSYISTEAGNRYATEENPAKPVKVNIKNPFVTDSNIFAEIQRAVIRKRFGKESIDELSDTEVDLLAEMMNEHFINEGYDSIYYPESETQEGELIVFDRNNVEFGPFESEIVKSPILKRLNKAFLKIGSVIMDNGKQLMDMARQLVEAGGDVRMNQTAGFQTRDGNPIGFNYDTDKVARERFDFSNLKKIGSGSDRDVYDLGDGKVLKVAKTARGLEQNIYEGDWLLSDQGIIPKSFERGLNYVIVENVNRETKGLQDFHLNGMLAEFKKFTQKDFNNKVSALQDVLNKYDMQGIMDYEVLWGDFTAKRNWGIKDGKPVHVDGGTFGGVQMLTSRKSTVDMTDPEFREIYQKSKELKKQFGDTDKNTRYSFAYRYDDAGEILGFTYNGKIYLNGEKITANTTMEEAGHVWINWAKDNRNDLYNAGLNKVDGTKYYKDVEANENYVAEALKQGKKGSKEYKQYLLEEALSKAIADQGARFVSETRKSDFKQWVKDLWKQVAQVFGIRDMSADQIQGLTLEEFARSVAADVFSTTKSTDDVSVAIKLAKSINEAPDVSSRKQAKRDYAKVDKRLRDIIDNIADIHKQLGSEITKIGECP